MTETNTSQSFDVNPGDIRFIDNFIPLLGDGDYTISVNLEENLSGGSIPDVNQVFTVSGPRFRLDSADIQKEYPPQGSQGTFEKCLPHIVLTKRALPWERDIFKDGKGEKYKTPWLALILLDADEILIPDIGSNKPSTPINPDPNDPGNKDYRKKNPNGVTTITLDELLKPGTGTVGPKVEFSHEDRSETCQVFDIAPQTFKNVIPPKQDLKYLVHCRAINMEQKSSSQWGSRADPLAAVNNNGTKLYSVLTGVRFPSPPADKKPGKLNVVHLVSLEGFEKYLDRANPVDFPAGTNRVRLVSLAAWNFTCLPERGQGLKHLMEGLEKEGETSGHAFRFKIPGLPPKPTPEQTFAKNVIDAGYVPRTYSTRLGENTFSWYRGPFTPQPVQPFAEDRGSFITAAQAMVYDKNYGLFDHSYAAAFEIGRLMALGDKSFGTLLLNWRSQALRSLHLLCDRIQLFQLDIEDLQVSDLHKLLEKNLVTDTFLKKLTDSGVHEIEAAVKKPLSQPPAAPSKVLRKYSSLPTQLREMFKQEKVLDFLKQMKSEEFDPICQWLVQLYLLHGLPSDNLVPDEALLPKESARIFYVDRNWMEVLIEGALSIGIHSGIDSNYQLAMRKKIRDTVLGLTYSNRNTMLGIKARGEQPPRPKDNWVKALVKKFGNALRALLKPGTTTTAGYKYFAGLLLRSAAVSGWPGLEIKAFAEYTNNTPSAPITLLRMDHLADDVLLCLFKEVPAWIEIDEPTEGLHFGVGDENKINLRQVTGANVGHHFDPKKTVTATRNEQQMLKIKELLSEMKEPLGKKEKEDVSPAEFALQMIWEPVQMVFKSQSK